MSLNSGVRIDEQEQDVYSGKSIINEQEELIIEDEFQSINFIGLTLDGILTLDGDLWLA